MTQEVVRKTCPLSTKQLVSSVVRFCEIIAEQKMYKFQKRIASRIVESMIDKDGSTVTGLVSRQGGKTETVSNVGAGVAMLLPVLAKQFPDDPRLARFADGVRVLIFGPYQEKAQLPYDRIRIIVKSKTARKLMASKDFNMKLLKDQKELLEFSTGSVVIARSASETTNNEGQTGHLVIFEETQAISRYKIEKEILPTTTNTRGTVVAIGTANQVSAVFREMIERNKEIEGQTGKQNHFESNWIEVCADRADAYNEEQRLYKEGKGPIPNEDHLNYALSIQTFIENKKEHTSYFRMNYLLMWEELGAGAIDRVSWNEAAIPTLEIGRRRYGGMRVAAIDIGKTNDSSFITVADLDWEHPVIDRAAQGDDKESAILYRKCFTDFASFKGKFEDKGGEMGQYSKIVNFLVNKGIGFLLVDETAMGDPVAERLGVLLEDAMEVGTFRFTGPSKLNLYRHYTQELDAGRISYVSGPITRSMEVYKDFVIQHTELIKVVDENKNTVKYQAPEGQHDDATDSAAMCCLAAKLVKGQLMPYIEMSEMPSFTRLHQPSGGRRKIMSHSPIYKNRR